MVDLSFNADVVKETVEGVKTSYTNLEEKIKEMFVKCNSVNNFWESKEQEKFSESLKNLNDDIVKFNIKYNDFLILLDSVITAYGKEKNSILEAINKELSNKK